jgi:hypothetical protein
MMLVELSERTAEHRLADNEFPDQVHHGINARGVDAKRTLGESCDR